MLILRNEFPKPQKKVKLEQAIKHNQFVEKNKIVQTKTKETSSVKKMATES